MLNRTLIERLVIVGIWLALGTIGVFVWQWQYGGGDEGDLTVARTAALTTMVLFQKCLLANKVLLDPGPAELGPA